MSAIAIERTRTGLSWAGVLRGAALGQVVGLAIAAAVLRDAEAAGISVATLVAFGLLRFRGGTLGKILLALLFVDVAFFMGAAAFTNLIGAADPAATVGPGVLSGIAILGLAAAIREVALRGQRSAPSAAVTVTTIVVTAAFLTLTAASLFTGGRTTAAASDVLRLETKNVSYSSTALDAKAGAITIRAKNGDLFWHTFTIDELAVDLRIPVGGEQQASFTAKPGTYRYYCAIPGHSSVMHGTLTVR